MSNWYYKVVQYFINRQNNKLESHPYGFSDNYNEAYEKFRELYRFYKELGLESTIMCMNPSLPEEKIEPYVRVLDKKGKQLITIIEVAKKDFTREG